LPLSPLTEVWALDQAQLKTPYSDFQVFPSELFVKESSPMIFSVKMDTTSKLKLAIIQIDETGKKLRYIGALTDDGFMGDKVKGDGIFTRKFQVSEKRPATLRFAVVEELTDVPSQVDLNIPGTLAQVVIIPRPSFVELVSTAFKKLWN
jgi:hypothetical protein